MKASQLVQLLLNLIVEGGDQEVILLDEDGVHSVSSVVMDRFIWNDHKEPFFSIKTTTKQSRKA